MANSDVLVRMKADTQNYDANIAKARKQLDAFKKDTGAKKVAASHEAKECTVIAEELTEELARKTVEKAGYKMTDFKREPYGSKGLFSK